ncbi:MAG: DUF4124 domain-containing protein [Betaproteobacteria bacterium]|nr:DUF4124 domain-containing protein [Betaproteobacteria bacterium]
MNSLNAALALAAILVGATGAHGQVYKWVDQNGVTNYAGKRPTDIDAGLKLDVVEERLSIYAQDKRVLRALDTASQGISPVLSNRIDSLERQLAAERQARQYSAAAEASALQAAYEQCLAQRRVDCDTPVGYFPYTDVGAPRHRLRQRPFVPGVSLSGVTAGNVTSAIRSADSVTLRSSLAPRRAFRSR